MSSEALALGITFLIHVVGMGILFAALLTGDDRGSWRGWWPRDDDGAGGGGDGPEPGAPPPGPPLGDAEQSRARLREPGRLADAHPGRARRPDHAPERAPARPNVPGHPL